MLKAIDTTDYKFPGQDSVYKGKVRDVYFIGEKLILIATDRISAFDHILKELIPFKGQVLNQMSAYFLKSTSGIAPNWLEDVPDPNVSAGKRCTPIRLEMVIRGYLAGHAWRIYKDGGRLICGEKMPDLMIQNQKFPSPILTPTFKALEGHDQDISREEILENNIVTSEQYKILEDYTFRLFEKGTRMAKDQGLILVDTKYEFGIFNNEIILIDEIHTPDSSRYYYDSGFDQIIAKGDQPKQLSKEFVREWLIAEGFQGLEGQEVPSMPREFVELVSDRYIELYERVSGLRFNRALSKDNDLRIKTNIENYLRNI